MYELCDFLPLQSDRRWPLNNRRRCMPAWSPTVVSTSPPNCFPAPCTLPASVADVLSLTTAGWLGLGVMGWSLAVLWVGGWSSLSAARIALMPTRIRRFGAVYGKRRGRAKAQRCRSLWASTPAPVVINEPSHCQCLDFLPGYCCC